MKRVGGVDGVESRPGLDRKEGGEERAREREKERSGERERERERAVERVKDRDRWWRENRSCGEMEECKLAKKLHITGFVALPMQYPPCRSNGDIPPLPLPPPLLLQLHI